MNNIKFLFVHIFDIEILGCENVLNVIYHKAHMLVDFNLQSGLASISEDTFQG